MTLKKKEDPCDVCYEPSKFICMGCHRRCFCSPEHQKQDWINGHKSNCRLYKVIKVDHNIQGRNTKWIATKDLEAGELLLDEPVTVRAPAYGWDIKYACVTCGLRFLSEQKDLCKHCKWPVCDSRCANDPTHTENECPIFASTQFTPAKSLNYRNDNISYTIMMIRGRALANSNPAVYRKLLGLMNFVDGKAGLPMQLQYRDAILALGCATGKSAQELKVYSDIFRVGYVNSFRAVGCYVKDATGEIIVKETPAPKVILRNFCLYAKAATIGHSCIPNCHYFISVEPDSRIRIYTSVAIKKGETFNILFDDIHNTDINLVPTYVRQESFWSERGFTCQCKRCLDPTELGTMWGAVACQECQSCDTEGYMLSSEPLSYEDHVKWICNSCGATKTADAVMATVVAVREEIRYALDKSINPMIAYMLLKDKYAKKVLHPQHYTLLEAEEWLAGNYEPAIRNRQMTLHGIDQRLEWYDHQWNIRKVCFPGFNWPSAHKSLFVAGLLYEKITRFYEIIGKKRTRVAFARLEKEFRHAQTYFKMDFKIPRDYILEALNIYLRDSKKVIENL